MFTIIYIDDVNNEAAIILRVFIISIHLKFMRAIFRKTPFVTSVNAHRVPKGVISSPFNGQCSPLGSFLNFIPTSLKNIIIMACSPLSQHYWEDLTARCAARRSSPLTEDGLKSKCIHHENTSSS